MIDDIISKHFQDWRQETNQHSEDFSEFLSWFNTSRSPGENSISGWWDFSYHILKPRLIALLGEPFEKTALEIGYGAARLLIPACHFFGHCIGVDIHSHRDMVEDLIRARNISNFTLLQTDGQTIPLHERTVDFVYSFIVLQHLPNLESLKVYLKEIHRVLKDGAPAILYMGYLPGVFRKRFSDLNTEKVETVRQVTLRLSIPLARAMINENGLFRIIEIKRALRRPWMKDKLSGQFYAIISKRRD